MIEWTPIKPHEVKWIGVDFDETIANNSGDPNYIPSTPIFGAVEALKAIDYWGYKIVIFTARPWVDYKNIEEWCDHFQIPARRIICGKPFFLKMIDDKNIEFHGNWLDVLDKIIKK